MNRLEKLVEQISSSLSPYGDWKMIKYHEYLLRGITPPYSEEEMLDYYEQRDLIRQEIEQIKVELGLGGTTPTETHTDTDEPIIEPEPPIIEVD